MVPCSSGSAGARADKGSGQETVPGGAVWEVPAVCGVAGCRCQNEWGAGDSSPGGDRRMRRGIPIPAIGQDPAHRPRAAAGTLGI